MDCDYLREIVAEEQQQMQKQFEGQFDDLNQLEHEIVVEMHRRIAEQLLRDQQIDDSANYELNERISEMWVQ